MSFGVRSGPALGGRDIRADLGGVNLVHEKPSAQDRSPMPAPGGYVVLHRDASCRQTAGLSTEQRT